MKLALGLVLAAALVLRLWNLDGLGIVHWDAGSYTAGPLGVGPYGKAPILHFYAPPLVPALHGLLFRLCGVSDTVVLVLAALVGTLTVAATWWLGQELLDERAALLGAAVLAGMDYHLAFSRQPLTDGLFTLLFVLAVLALARAARGAGAVRCGLLAGAATALAFLTKYHGFFPLVLMGAVWLLRLRNKGLLAALLVAGAVTACAGAFLVHVIERDIGLAAFQANRDQWLRAPDLSTIQQSLFFVARCLFEWTEPALLAFAVGGLVLLAWRRRLCDLVLLLWIALFVATLPFYARYPRLLVPLLPALALAAGHALATAGKTLSPRATLALALGVVALGVFDARHLLVLETRSYAKAADILVQAGPDPDGRPDLLVTQHSLLFYLRDAPNSFVCYDEAGAADVLRSGRYRFLVADVRTRKAPEFAAAPPPLVAQIENPLPEPFLVNLEGFEGLDLLRDPATPDELREELGTIRLYRRSD